MNIVIEQGVPIPVGKGASKYPFGALQVGESFLAPDMRTSEMSGYRAYALRKHPDREFVTRAVDGGTRVWRTK